MQHKVAYTVAFAAGVCLVCSILVSGSAVSLADLQDANKAQFRKENVLQAAGLLGAEEEISAEEVEERFAPIEQVVVDLTTGREDAETRPAEVDQKKMTSDPRTSFEVSSAEAKLAQVKRVSNKTVIYRLFDDSGELEMIILPVEGKGLWSTLYGFVALGADLQTIEGLTFYEHKETPGLGGEVDNPSWKALWPGRQAFGPEGEVAIEVIKGQAGPPSEDPYRVDGLSGATITSRGVGHLLRFWLGGDGFGPYLDSIRQTRRDA